MDCPPIPQFIALISFHKTYLKERPPSASIANKEFPLSNMPARGCSETGLHTLYTRCNLHSCTVVYMVLSPQCHALFALLCALTILIPRMSPYPTV